MQSISSSESLELIVLDFLHLNTRSGGYQYLLVTTDPFSHFLQLNRTPSKSAKTTADGLCKDFMLIYGIPANILHDQRKEFENNLFAQFCKLCEIKRLKTSPYHPQTKRMNQASM